MKLEVGGGLGGWVQRVGGGVWITGSWSHWNALAIWNKRLHCLSWGHWSESCCLKTCCTSHDPWLHVVPPASCPVYPLTATCLQWILLGVGNHNITVSRDHLATWNERARSVASGRLSRVDARVGARVRSPNHPLLSHASLTYFFRDLCNCHTWHPRIWHPQIVIPIFRCMLPQIIGSWKIQQNHVVLQSSKQKHRQKNVRRHLDKSHRS